MSTARLLFVTAATGLLLSACWPDRLSDKACDDEHPCIDGYICLSDVCYARERLLFDGGPPPPPPTDGGR